VVEVGVCAGLIGHIRNIALIQCALSEAVVGAPNEIDGVYGCKPSIIGESVGLRPIAGVRQLQY
jgi:hypothetical protein